MRKVTEHQYRSSLRAHIRRLEAQLRKEIREGRPSDHIATQLDRYRAELQGV